MVTRWMSPPTGEIATSKRSVCTTTGSPDGTEGAAAGTCAAIDCPVAAALVAAGAAGAVGVVAVPAGGAEGMEVAGVCVTFGAVCFCHASHRSSAENEKTMRAMRRCVSII